MKVFCIILFLLVLGFAPELKEWINLFKGEK